MEIAKHLRKLTAVLSIVTVLFTLTLLAETEKVPSAEQPAGGGLSLQPPPFIESAHAATLEKTDMSFLLEEAGITAYTKLDRQLDFSNLRPRFKTFEQETDQFIIGIVTAPGYERLPEFDENAEVQVFLHRDGWIVAYLTRYQTASALFDWVNYEEKRLTGTIIESVVRLLALDSGVDDFDVAYYDFRYPDATNLMLVADHADADRPNESFEITIPRQLTVYESFWSSAQFGIDTYYNSRYPGECILNDEKLASLDPGGERWGLWSGELTKTKLPPDTNHKLSVSASKRNSYCGIAIVYREAEQ